MLGLCPGSASSTWGLKPKPTRAEMGASQTAVLATQQVAGASPTASSLLPVIGLVTHVNNPG